MGYYKRLLYDRQRQAASGAFEDEAPSAVQFVTPVLRGPGPEQGDLFLTPPTPTPGEPDDQS